MIPGLLDKNGTGPRKLSLTLFYSQSSNKLAAGLLAITEKGPMPWHTLDAEMASPDPDSGKVVSRLGAQGTGPCEALK